MKKVLVILALFAVAGIASAEMLNNPESFNGYADGTVLWDYAANGGAGGPLDGWEGWGSTWGPVGGWVGGNDLNMVQGGQVISQAPSNGVDGDYAYNLLFNHGNEIASLPAGSATVGTVDVTFDLINISGDGIVKIEFYDDLARTTQIYVEAWDPITLAPGTHTFSATIPAGAYYVTPVIGVTGLDSWGVFDNVGVTGVIPEPATIALLGLGGLFLRRRK